MTIAPAILATLSGGHATAQQIAEHIGAPLKSVKVAIWTLKRAGRVRIADVEPHKGRGGARAVYEIVRGQGCELERAWARGENRLP